MIVVKIRTPGNNTEPDIIGNRHREVRLATAHFYILLYGIGVKCIVPGNAPQVAVRVHGACDIAVGIICIPGNINIGTPLHPVLPAGEVALCDLAGREARIVSAVIVAEGL